MPRIIEEARGRALQASAMLSGLALIAFVWPVSTLGADTLRLRNLDVVSGRTVTAFDEDGVRFDKGEPITWDEIEKGTIDPARQEEFNKLLKELGEPLFQIRRRLKVADYEGLLAPAESLYPRYSARKSDTAYMVIQAVMWARLAAGRRETAVEPYLRGFEFLRSEAGKAQNLPGDRRLAFDGESGLSPELPPVWFDAEAAKAALPGVFEAIRQMADPRPEGVRIYYGTLALAAGDLENAQRVLSGIKGEQRAVAEMKDIALAQQEVLAGQSGPALLRLAGSIEGYSALTRPAALYWLGVSKISATGEPTRREGVLQLLAVPAIFGKAYPELAGAALYQAMKTLAELEDAKGSVAVRRELLVKYSQTVHAAKVRAESEIRKD